MLKYFSLDEFDCQETGENEMNEEFLHSLDALREACGFPFRITSGYRSPEHSKERIKSFPGTHAQGLAADIYVADGIQRRLLVKTALELNFEGIGVAETFVHVDRRGLRRDGIAEVLWGY